MVYTKVLLQEIDFSDESYRVTDDFDLERMQASLKEIGQLNPVVLLRRRDGGKQIVCGFRRLHALKRLGKTEALARIEQSSCTPLPALSMALLDNVSHRVLTPLECSRALFALKHVCGVDSGALVTTWLPLLGLRPHEKVLSCYLSLHDLAPALQDFLRQGTVALASAGLLAAMPREVQERFVALFERARFSASLQRKMLELLDELGAMAQGGMLEVLDQLETASILMDPGLSPWQRGERIHDTLYRMRFPRLSGARGRFRAAVDSLALPGTIAVIPDPFFETQRIRFQFDAGSASQFRELADTLHRAARDPALDFLFGDD